MSAKLLKRIAGIVLIVMSIAHVIYGEVMHITALKSMAADDFLIGSYRAMSLQGGLLLAAVGIVELLSAERVISLPGFTAFIPLGIVSINLIAFAVIIAAGYRHLLQYSIPQLPVFIIIIGIQAWSLRKAR
ncbi:hypothetical protein [Paenibacillus hamazuiensis]|uniref:hypothetical protein n=1 Tax=Paenibacillus hamazuiensis TaxID=2936508 RepID=UPI002010266A|nr:hypothetical protein [Paenibacillus hamazuiensis]